MTPVVNYRLQTKYNEVLKHKGIALSIVEWAIGKITLSTGVVLEGSEFDGFRRRFKSKLAIAHFDRLYAPGTDEPFRLQAVKQIVAEESSVLHKQWWADLPPDVREQHNNHLREQADHYRATADYSTRRSPERWNKGKTKHTDPRLLKNSIDRTGAGNPMFGTKMSQEEKQRKSTMIKERIASGAWTPHVHNSRTHWESSYRGKTYRSSWEAMYAMLNPDDTYENVRIRYEYAEQQHIYIVDFVNHTTRVLTEIKPDVHTSDPTFEAKHAAAITWCNDNGYTYQVLTEQYFVDNMDKVVFDDLVIPNKRVKLQKITYEANTKNRDTPPRNDVQPTRS